MNSSDIILIVLIVVAFLLLLKHFLYPAKNIKPTYLKKEEIIESYKTQMLNIKATYENDKETFDKQRMIFLKNVSAELHKNIFFDEEEIKEIIKELASI